jgi:hypothetical protein
LRSERSWPRARGRLLEVVAVLGCAFAAAGAAPAASDAASSGGIGDAAGTQTQPRETRSKRAKLVGGRAIAPRSAPRKVKRAIAAANRIVEGKSYCYGGGHSRWQSRCYDCSGSVSYALGKPGARVLKAPMPSGSFMNWGRRGKGQWITTYANSGHIYAVIAGLRLDTSMTDGDGPGWSKDMRASGGFRVRHPAGL